MQVLLQNDFPEVQRQQYFKGWRPRDKEAADQYCRLALNQARTFDDLRDFEQALWETGRSIPFTTLSIRAGDRQYPDTAELSGSQMEGGEDDACTNGASASSEETQTVAETTSEKEKHCSPPRGRAKKDPQANLAFFRGSQRRAHC